jgi:hypothetical protein
VLLHGKLPRAGPSSFLFCYLLPFVVLCYTYLFSARLLSTSLSLVPAHHPTIQPDVFKLCTWYFYHAIALDYYFPLLFLCFRLSFINLILASPHFCHVSDLACLAITQNSFYHGASLSSYTDHHTPVHPTTCNNPIG